MAKRKREIQMKFRVDENEYDTKQDEKTKTALSCSAIMPLSDS